MIALSVISLVVQLITLQMHNIQHVVPVPKWLKSLAKCLACQRRSNRFDLRDKLRAGHENIAFTGDNANTSQRKEKFVMVQCGDKILYELTKIGENMSKQDEKAKMKGEWQATAKILDRFFFLVFLFSHILLLIVSVVFSAMA